MLGARAAVAAMRTIGENDYLMPVPNISGNSCATSGTDYTDIREESEDPLARDRNLAQMEPAAVALMAPVAPVVPVAPVAPVALSRTPSGRIRPPLVLTEAVLPTDGVFEEGRPTTMYDGVDEQGGAVQAPARSASNVSMEPDDVQWSSFGLHTDLTTSL